MLDSILYHIYMPHTHGVQRPETAIRQLVLPHSLRHETLLVTQLVTKARDCYKTVGPATLIKA